MKTAYLAIAIFALLFAVVSSFITIAPPMDVVVARQLGRNPDSWNLHLSGNENRLGDSAYQKEMLVRYIERSGNPLDRESRKIEAAVLVVSLFSFFGWVRERHYEKKNGA